VLDKDSVFFIYPKRAHSLFRRSPDHVPFAETSVPNIFSGAIFWHCMRPELDRSEHPRLPVKLEQAIHSSFQSLKNFQDLFTDAVMKLFGSGWVWLVMDSSHKLKIFSLPNAESPLKSGLIPILTCDVWEHSYYIDYRNNRRKYVESFMKVINWSFALQNFERAQIPDMTQTMRFNFKAEETKVETTKPLFMKEV